MPIPINVGNAFSAASLVNTTRFPRVPDGGRSLASSTLVNTPLNIIRFGCLPFGISAAIASTLCTLTPPTPYTPPPTHKQRLSLRGAQRRSNLLSLVGLNVPRKQAFVILDGGLIAVQNLCN